MKPEIIYANRKHFHSFQGTLDQVAKERIYIEMIEAPPVDRVSKFQQELIAMNGPSYYAVVDEKVVGWCDVFPESNPRMSHRGCLGMGIRPEWRGQGLGSELMVKTLDHAQRFGFEKVELSVYTSNTAAVALYKKFGFIQEGVIKKFRKLDDRYFDCLIMAKFL